MMMNPKKLFAGLAFAGLFGLSAVSAQAETQVVMLGTGTPVPDADHSGPSTAVIYNGEAYVFDVGPGMVRSAITAAQKKGIDALYPTKIKRLFITHLHSDHILDYPELASTYWWRRTEGNISVWGPTGLNEMTDGYYLMTKRDIELRTTGLNPVKDPTGYQYKTHEYDQGGWTVKDGDVTVEAFEVPHGDITPAFGYRITTPDKTIVISGDTSYSEKLVEMAKGADILVHEVICEEGWEKLPENWQKYHAAAHTKTDMLARVANEAKPGLLVLTHVLSYSAPRENTLTEVKALYDGEVVLAEDLDIY
ncbi:MBL fold metallo-hydrolase [Marinobacterium lutimaris]|uniref:RNAse Z n=1 Tax=Marinobacterium lutimaris TaxID=568106 RepID=A0A1H5Y4Y8_9GAMM|nr:MBL fold metallo-hydrolase [Marinobacterium lutimaris]SEG19051.1 RNAse Z [Marinobacterium lutimaris]